MSKETKSNHKWPTTKDFIYWQIFSVILLICVFSNNIPSPEVLSDKLALGAAIFSILLAVVAIIIPFIQSNETSRQSYQVLSELSKITSDIAVLKAIRSEVNEDIQGTITEVLNAPQPEQAAKDFDDLKKQYDELAKAMSDLKTRANNFNNLTSQIPGNSVIKGTMTVTNNAPSNKYWGNINNYKNKND